jgi:hypothetical protein
MQSKVPCPKCGVLYAWNASQKRVRNHGSCRFDTPAPKKPSFSVRIAPPQANVSDNVRVSNVWGYDADQLQSDKKKTEDEYRKNSLENEQWMREARKKYDTELKEKEALDKIEAEQKEARDKAEAEKKRRFYQPQYTALNIKKQQRQQSSDISVYWIDSNGGFYNVNDKDPYMQHVCRTPSPSPPPRLRKKMWCKVYWNSNFGVTTDMCEGEWEMQWVYRFV